MTRSDAIALIRSAVPVPGGTWADFGAGRGTFAEALAVLLGEQGRVIAIDRDRNALRDLKHLASQARGATIEVAAGDLLQLDSISALSKQRLDGALFANVLHYVAEPDLVLARLRDYLHPQATVCIIEYDRTSANRWVPYPLPLHKLAAAARRAGLSEPVEIGRQKSRFQGELYCVVMTAPNPRGVKVIEGAAVGANEQLRPSPSLGSQADCADRRRPSVRRGD